MSARSGNGAVRPTVRDYRAEVIVVPYCQSRLISPAQTSPACVAACAASCRALAMRSISGCDRTFR